MQSLRYTLRMLRYTNIIEVFLPLSFCHQYFFFILIMEGKWCFGHEEMWISPNDQRVHLLPAEMHNDCRINTKSAEEMFLYVATLCFFTMAFELFCQVATKITWLGFLKKEGKKNRVLTYLSPSTRSNDTIRWNVQIWTYPKFAKT